MEITPRESMEQGSMAIDSDVSTGDGGEALRRYGLAVLAAMAALMLRQVLMPVMGERNPYHTVWAAVAFSASYCGLWPSLITTAVSMIGVWYWFLPPFHSFGLDDTRSAISGMLGFLVFSLIIIAMGESSRRSLAKRQWAEDELRKAHDELERKVEERTTNLNAANESLRELSSRLQEMRDEEHRQIARELHDSVGQLLAALGMNLATLQRQVDQLDSAGARAVSENAAMVDQISREIRTISHLLHPPLLDAAGLASALRWYVDGFSERSHIKVQLDIPEEFGRLSEEMEMAIFRMVQECLTNIHRHSGGDSATIRMHEENNRVLVEVQDCGKGMHLEIGTPGRTGVGLRGMQERFRQLGGTFEIRSGAGGTAVMASLPLEDLQSAPTEIKAS